MRQSKCNLYEQLGDQLGFLATSSLEFDSGRTSEALRLASTVRLLVNDRGRSISLLEQLGLKGRLFPDSSAPVAKENLVAHCGLVAHSIGSFGHKFVAPLDEVPHEIKWVCFREWWNATVFLDASGNVFTRGDLVLTLADKDGGVHVDPILEDDYALLSRENSLGVFAFVKESRHAGARPELAAVRQIAHEISRSLEPLCFKSRRRPAGEVVLFHQPVITGSPLPGCPSFVFDPADGSGRIQLRLELIRR